MTHVTNMRDIHALIQDACKIANTTAFMYELGVITGYCAALLDTTDIDPDTRLAYDSLMQLSMQLGYHLSIKER